MHYVVVRQQAPEGVLRLGLQDVGPKEIAQGAGVKVGLDAVVAGEAAGYLSVQ